MELLEESFSCSLIGIWRVLLMIAVVGIGVDVITNLDAFDIENVIEDITFKLVVVNDSDAGAMSRVLLDESGTKPKLVNAATPLTNGMDSVPLRLYPALPTPSTTRTVPTKPASTVNALVTVSRLPTWITGWVLRVALYRAPCG
jgi:hypothetical protein